MPSTRVLQFGSNGAERRAEIGADQREGGDRRDRDQCGNQRIFDRRDPRLVFDQIRKTSAQRVSPWFDKSNRAKIAIKTLNNVKPKGDICWCGLLTPLNDLKKSPVESIILGSRQEGRANPA